ncbi:MAG: glycoside hydrolase family 2 TIM barrel-domain containing protein, partial [Verrucomicrobiota bacterium]
KIPVIGPAKWDSEHPNLYTLTIELKADGKLLETVIQRVGFRQVEVRGNQMFVNNMPVKLRGICRHEADPLHGRSLAPGTWRKDAELFRTANCNYIRTSHYPPAEEFLEACDELGLFVECEGPFCWAGQTKITSAEVPDLITRQHLEMLEAYRNHPSITQWSLANESGAFGEYFLPSAKLLRQLDPTRLLVFSDMTGGGGEPLDISNNHYPGYCDAKYPGLEGPARYADSKQPMIFDEYCHLNSYNRLELATDPGLRDIWGLGLAGMWQNILKSKGCLGGAIWSGVDDTFFLPNGKIVGYGPWGPIDGWRRPKPEYWNMKNAYSPLAVKETSMPANKPVRLTIENHQTFTDLKEMRFEWKCGKRSGTARTTSVPPGQTGTLDIPVSDAGKMLEVSAISPGGLNIDVWQIALGTDPRTALPVPAAKPGPVTLEKPAGKIIVRTAGFTVTFDAATGMATAPFTGTDLLLLSSVPDSPGGGMEAPSQLYSETCSNWKALAITAEATADQGVAVRVEGAYAEAQGTYIFQFAKDGTLTLDYDFAVTEKGQRDPRQIGVVFRLPRECDTLTWRRNAKWSAYPDDHIGRAQGTATAFVKGVPISLLAGPRERPTWSWSDDATPNGCNDFRSTKMNVYEAALLSPSGQGLRLLSDGSAHVRCWVVENSANLLVAEYTNHGAPQFFTEHVIPARPLKAG